MSDVISPLLERQYNLEEKEPHYSVIKIYWFLFVSYSQAQTHKTVTQSDLVYRRRRGYVLLSLIFYLVVFVIVAIQILLTDSKFTKWAFMHLYRMPKKFKYFYSDHILQKC